MKNKIIEALTKVQFISDRALDAKAIQCFLAEQKIKRGSGPIRVGFLCQYLPAWTKVKELYQILQEDSRFEVFLICVPLGIHNHSLDNPESLENEAYEYCLAHGYSEAINALIGKGKWFDLKSLNLEYLFYPRPYNSFMPYEYTTRQVSRYCKICLVMYGIEKSETTDKIQLNRDFMSNVYFYFADFLTTKNFNVKRNRFLHLLGLQKTEHTGYPMIEHLHHYQHSESKSWAFSENSFRVMWTPRWASDPALGGSNFLKYYNAFLRFAETHHDIDFLFRPHPLTFSHLLAAGQLTERDLNDFIRRCDELPNVALDKEAGYEATFWNSSVLVSDISSIIPEYLSLEKPVVLCVSNMGMNLAPHFVKMLEGCYIVNDEEEMFRCIRMLQAGEDPLADRRREISNELFGSCKNGVYEAIMNHLIADSKTQTGHSV